MAKRRHNKAGYVPAPFGGARKKGLNPGLAKWIAEHKGGKGAGKKGKKGGFLGSLVAPLITSIVPGLMERLLRRKGEARHHHMKGKYPGMARKKSMKHHLEQASKHLGMAKKCGGLTRDGKKPMKGLLGSTGGRRHKRHHGMGSSANYGPSI